MRILYCGSDEFSIKVLQSLMNQKNIQVEVLGPSNKILKEKRESSIYVPSIVRYCNNNNIPYVQSIDVLKDKIINKKYDALVAVSFNKFIKASLLNYFTYNFNLHPSLLPFYKGSSPIQRSLINNEKYIGITIQAIDSEKFDNGKIYMQTKPLLVSDLTNKNYMLSNVEYVYDKNKTDEICLNEDDRDYRFSKIMEPNSKKFNYKYDYLRNSLAMISGDLMKEFFSKQIYNCHTTNTNDFIQYLPFKQPFFAKKINNSTFQLNWLKESISTLVNKVNITDDCCYSYVKEIYTKNDMTLWRPRKVFFRNVNIFRDSSPFLIEEKVGSFRLFNNNLLVKCANNQVLQVNELKPEGAKTFITPQEFFLTKFKKLYKHQIYLFNTIKEIREEYENNLSKIQIDKTIEAIIYENSKKKKNCVETLHI
ncbi:hypothetical protein QEN19_004298 [Hanseniaspora menglaensis]